MIKAITFDLEGVYFASGEANFIAALGKLGVSEKEAKKVFLQSDEMNKLYKTGKMTDEEFWTWAVGEWGIKLSVEQVIDLLIEGYEVNEDIFRVLEQSKKNGYLALICSNNFPARINGLQQRFHFLEDFDTMVFSYEVGFTKPDKRIFEALVNQSGVKAEEIVFADDNQENLAGAKEVGIETFLYEDFGKFFEKLKKLGVKLD